MIGFFEKSSHSDGFTLLELMITIVISSLVLVFSAPVFREMIANNRSTGLANDLVAALNLTRSEAVRRGADVSVCASSDGNSCASSWAQGWIVFVDSDENGSRDTGVGSSEAVLRVWPATRGNPSITSTPAGINGVRFDEVGESANPVSFSVILPNCKGEQARTVDVTLAGGVGVRRVACP